VDAERLQLVALAAGVALADAIRRLTKVEARLKWPNDVLVGDRKLGGVLVDAVYGGQGPPSFMLVGVGVNGDARSEEFPPDLAGATSLSLAAGRHVCLPALLKLFLEAFEARYDALAAGRTEGVWSEARRLLETLGRRVRVQTETGPVVGDAIDLGPGGELLVRMPGTVLAVRSGECEELRNA
jgi:BirA family biotin operon repressor/biotin-[acetyl-CoA-carboxylase] ligase